MSDLHARVAAQLYAFLHAENDAGTASENATVILDMVAEALMSDDTVREIAGAYDALVPNGAMREVLVRGILNTATYAAGIRTAPGDAGVTTGEGA